MFEWIDTAVLDQDVRVQIDAITKRILARIDGIDPRNGGHWVGGAAGSNYVPPHGAGGSGSIYRGKS